MIRIGTSLTTSYGKGANARDGADAVIAASHAASEAGLDSVFLGDHHNTGPSVYYQNVPLLGRLLAEWRGGRAGILALLPLWQPVLLAEQIGTLAALTDARFVLQCSLGDEAHQFEAFDADRRQRVPMFEHCLATVQALLRGETVRGTTIAPVPDRTVEYWVGAMASAGLDRAARTADGWLANPGSSVHVLRDRVAYYLDACARHERTPTAVAVRRDIFVGASDGDARQATRELLAGGYRGIDPDVLVIGSAQTVAERFASLAELGFTDVIVRHVRVSTEQVLDSTQRLAEVRSFLAR